MRSLLIVFLFGLGAAAHAASEPFAGCRQIADDAARLRCYDAAADELLQSLRGVAQPAAAEQRTAAPASPPSPTTGPTASAATPTPAPASATPVTSDSLFGKEAAATEKVVKQVLGVEAVSSITSTIKHVDRTPLGRMQLQLANGQSWLQIDDAKLTLKDGDDVVIRTASLGSYLLEKASGSRRIRVKRTD